ncbi:hypothetical protein F5Y17DRAFT_451003 [Xylariaceae sp. FL0594]|nr:hypothetical protein F5Y17DRAFT_451003 [Xylariaceae sp. FL0594]
MCTGKSRARYGRRIRSCCVQPSFASVRKRELASQTQTRTFIFLIIAWFCKVFGRRTFYKHCNALINNIRSLSVLLLELFSLFNIALYNKKASVILL